MSPEFIELTANLEKLSYKVSSDGSEVTDLGNQVWPLEEFLRVLIILTRQTANQSKHEFLEVILPIIPMSETQIKTDQLRRVKKMELVFDKIKTETFGLGQGKVFANTNTNGSDNEFINQEVLDAFEEDFIFQSQLGSQNEGGRENESVLGPDPDFDRDVKLLANFVEHWISVRCSTVNDVVYSNFAKLLLHTRLTTQFVDSSNEEHMLPLR